MNILSVLYSKLPPQEADHFARRVKSRENNIQMRFPEGYSITNVTYLRGCLLVIKYKPVNEAYDITFTIDIARDKIMSDIPRVPGNIFISLQSRLAN